MSAPVQAAAILQADRLADMLREHPELAGSPVTALAESLRDSVVMGA
jgi:hypothetical protein